MALTINSNILSLNAQRRFGEATKSLSESFSKLSSGLRINKASDDAAGLAISENLKTDTKLVSQAIRNVNDGVSMVSIISGALESQKGILYRMAELAEQSANGTNSQAQRNAMQQEYMSLQEEFDRVASSATFNGISLLRNPDGGTLKLLAGITGADESLLSVAAANSHRFAGGYVFVSDISENGLVDLADLSATGHSVTGNYNLISQNLQNNISTVGTIQAVDSINNIVDIRFNLSRLGADMGQSTPLGGTPASLISFFYAVDEDGNSSAAGSFVTINSTDKSLTISGTIVNTSATFSKTIDISGIIYSSADNPNDVDYNSAIGLTSIKYQADASLALDTVSNKIQDLSRLQGSFGALESRLSVAVNKLQVDRENYQSASSQITDIDVGIESSKLLRGQILQQAAGSILAQANQQPSLALKLLGGI